MRAGRRHLPLQLSPPTADRYPGSSRARRFAKQAQPQPHLAPPPSRNWRDCRSAPQSARRLLAARAVEPTPMAARDARDPPQSMRPEPGVLRLAQRRPAPAAALALAEARRPRAVASGWPRRRCHPRQGSRRRASCLLRSAARWPRSACESSPALRCLRMHGNHSSTSHRPATTTRQHARAAEQGRTWRRRTLRREDGMLPRADAAAALRHPARALAAPPCAAAAPTPRRPQGQDGSPNSLPLGAARLRSAERARWQPFHPRLHHQRQPHLHHQPRAEGELKSLLQFMNMIE